MPISSPSATTPARISQTRQRGRSTGGDADFRGETLRGTDMDNPEWRPSLAGPFRSAPHPRLNRRMDASPLPVLSRWSAAAAGAARGAPALTAIDGIAPTADEALRRATAAWPGRDVLVLHAQAMLPPDGWR